MPASLARAEWVGFTTIVIREFNRIVRIWGQTIVPPVVTATPRVAIEGYGRCRDESPRWLAPADRVQRCLARYLYATDPDLEWSAEI